jgi:predicted helicase
MAISEKALLGIRSMDDVLSFLHEELEWPVDIENMARATYSYSAEDLGVNPRVAQKVNSIRQLKPAAPSQPWAIFLLDLADTGLSKKAVREVLKTLTSKRRATKQPGLWGKDNLLFLVSNGAGESFEIHFLAFKEDYDGKSRIYTIDWRPAQTTRQYSMRLRSELLPRLSWPKNPNDAKLWQEIWGDAFFIQPGQVMRDANDLVSRMANVAISMRNSIVQGLKNEKASGPLHKLLDSIKSELVGDVEVESFADMCAQTITYGLLAARVQDPEGFGASPALNFLPLNNPFLEALFAEVQDAIAEVAKDEKDLEELYADLRATNVELILDQFGNSANGGDPVIHFYESFLAQYDRNKKIEVGAFYTPKPIVDAMVKLVDEALRKRFGLSLGVASRDTWREVSERLETRIPEGVDPQKPFLSILDPATGTGTYLMSLVSQARENLKAVGMNDREVEEELATGFLANLHAFELMLGPYAIANLKLGLSVAGQDSNNQSKIIYLTNTLEVTFDDNDLFEEDGSVISEEAKKAKTLKIKEPFNVIIGNPPYMRERNNAKKGYKADYAKIIRQKDSAIFGARSPLSDFTDTLPQAGVPPTMNSHLQNLYVYFWRWATWQAHQKFQNNLLEPRGFSSPGIVCFITGSSYISAQSFAGFRKFMRDCYDEILVIDLGGSSYAGLKDPNVFDIMSPVSIMIGVRNSDDPSPAKVRYLKINGSRMEKLDAVRKIGFEDGNPVFGSDFEPFISRESNILTRQPYLDKVFGQSISGLKPGRSWVSSPSLKVLEERWAGLVSSKADDRRINFREGSSRKITTQTRSLINGQPYEKTVATLSDGDSPEKYIEYSYRPYDQQFLILDGRLLSQVSKALLFEKEGQFFLSSGDSLSGGPSVIAFPNVPDMPSFRGKMASKDCFPRFIDSEIEFNLLPEYLSYSKELAGEEAEARMLSYIYGIHGSGAYFETFKRYLGLGLDRAKLPLTKDHSLFLKIADIGAALLNQHLGKNLFSSQTALQALEPDLNPIQAAPSTITFHNQMSEIWFDDVRFCDLPFEIWSFYANGFYPVQSWLKNRTKDPKGKRSSPLDDINETKWIYNDEFKKMIADVSAVIEAKKLVMPLMEQLVEELNNQPGK